MEDEYKKQEIAYTDLKRKFDDQTRLLTNVVTHNKNHADSLKTIPDIACDGNGTTDPAERAKEEAMRSERIAKSMNRSSFMGLGDNPPKLISESGAALTKHVKIAGDDQSELANLDDPFRDKNASYLTDDSVPS